MAYSTLKRRTPLKRTPFKRRMRPRKSAEVQIDATEAEKPAEAKKTAKTGIKKKTPDLKEKLDRVFSLYIRLRDAMYGGNTRCISCGKILPFSQMQCGHYVVRANMSVRWDEDNAHSECAQCNCMNADHITGYKANLIKKIGQQKHDELMERSKETWQWSDEELRALIRHYTAEVRMLSIDRGILVKV